MKKALIFDGLNLFLRNFVVSPLADSNGEPIGGYLGSLRSVKAMIRETGADRVFFVWDGPGGAQRRRGVVADYKMGRRPRLNREFEEGTRSSAQNMAWQKERLRSSLKFLGVTQIEVENIEADDAIGYLVGLLGPTPKVVVSSDRDMWQLVSDTTVVYWPTKKVYITAGTFREHCPFHPANFVLARAMSGKGDASDNVHGVKGLGEKTLLKLFPALATVPLDLKYIMDECRGQVINRPQPLRGVKRWYSVILESQDLVSRNVQVMQLIQPDISPQAAGIIKNAAAAEPSFNMSGFKVALINNGTQLTDRDFFTTFQEYRLRASNGDR